MPPSLEEELRIKFDNSIWPVNPRGNKDVAFIEFRHAVLIKNVQASLIYEKWKEYNEMCMKEGRESKYIKSLESFLKEAGWSGDYKSVDSKTKSFIDSWLKGLFNLFHF